MKKDLSNAILEQLAGFPFMQNQNLSQVNEYKQFLREKERKDAEFELGMIKSIYKTSTYALKGIWNKISGFSLNLKGNFYKIANKFSADCDTRRNTWW